MAVEANQYTNNACLRNGYAHRPAFLEYVSYIGYDPKTLKYAHGFHKHQMPIHISLYT